MIWRTHKVFRVFLSNSVSACLCILYPCFEGFWWVLLLFATACLWILWALGSICIDFIHGMMNYLMNVDFDSVSCKPYRYELVSQKDDCLEWWKFGGSVLFYLFCTCDSVAMSLFCIYVSHLCFPVIPIVIPFVLYFSVLSIFIPFPSSKWRAGNIRRSCSKCSNCRKKRSEELVPTKIIKAKLVPSLLFGSQHSSQFRFPMISSYLMLYDYMSLETMVLANSSDPRIPGYPPSRNRTSDASEKIETRWPFWAKHFGSAYFSLGTNRSHMK